MLSCRQWDGLRWSEIHAWLGNFGDDIGAQYYSMRVLINLLYYSERDMELLAQEGVRRIVSRKILPRQIGSGFSISNDELVSDYRRELNETLFVPLLVKDKPYESGNQIARLFVQRLQLPEARVMAASSIQTSGSVPKTVVVFDDCMGSGDELREFWSGATIADHKTRLRDWCRTNGIGVQYLSLVGYQGTMERLKLEFDDIYLECVEVLMDRQRVFVRGSTYWDNDAEARDAYQFFNGITTARNLDLLGYGDLGFAVIMHLTVPDWSLPMLWKKVPGWTILIARKNS